MDFFIDIFAIFLDFGRFWPPTWTVLGGFSAVFLWFFRIVFASCWLPGPGRPQELSEKASGSILNDFFN